MEKNLKDSIEKKVGASEIPDMFSAYNDIAYTIDQMHGIVDLNKYFSELCKLELAACEPTPTVKEQLNELRLIKSFIDAAKAKVEQCNELHQGMELFKYAQERLHKYASGGCSTCH